LLNILKQLQSYQKKAIYSFPLYWRKNATKSLQGVLVPQLEIEISLK
jgi:hypothetical protein